MTRKEIHLRENIHLGSSNLRKTLTKPQRIFHETIQKFIEEEAKLIVKEMKTSVEKEIKYLQQFLGAYTFHDNKTVCIDCDLYDIMNYGHAEFGAYSRLKILIDKNLEDKGYYMECQNYSTWNFVRN